MAENNVSQGGLGFDQDAGAIVPNLGVFFSHHGRQSEVRQ